MWNVLYFHVPDGSRFLKCNKNRCFFWSFHHLHEAVFHPFVLFQAMRSGSVWFTGLKCGNHFALLLQCSHCLEMFLLFFFFFELARPLLLCW